MLIPKDMIVAAFAGTLASTIFSMLWFSPQFFGEQWMKLVGIKKASSEGTHKKMLISMLANVAMAANLYIILGWAGIDGVISGGMLGLMIGVGIASMTLQIPAIWEGRDQKLYMINAGHAVFSMTIMGMTIGAVS